MTTSRSSNTPLFIGLGCGCAALLALLVVVVLVITVGGSAVGGLVGGGSEEEEGQGPTRWGGIDHPPGVVEDQSFLLLGDLSPESSAPVVDLHMDFFCPHCKNLHDTDDGSLQEMAVNGEITLRLHPRAMLDASSDPTGYSSMAANAAVCAYAEDPSLWWEAEDVLWANQPESATVEADAAEVAVWMLNAGLPESVATCIQADTYGPWIREVVEPAALDQADFTPALFVDGAQTEVDLAVEDPVRTAIEGAAG